MEHIILIMEIRGGNEHEPIFICKLNKHEKMKYEDIPMKVSHFPIHTQSSLQRGQLRE